jgi:hypothetical protein
MSRQDAKDAMDEEGRKRDSEDRSFPFALLTPRMTPKATSLPLVILSAAKDPSLSLPGRS